MVPRSVRRGTTRGKRPHRTTPPAPVPIGADTIGLMQIVVVGAGVMGTWTALWLCRASHDVTLVDRHGPGNRLGSSGDESRITRSSHGPDRHYPVWQRRALGHWRDLERTSGTKLFEQAGVLWLANDAQSFEGESAEVLADLRIPIERWTSDDLATRLPVVNPEGVPWALLEPEAGALFARPAVMAAQDRFVSEGGRIVVGRVLPPGTPSAGEVLGRVTLDDGQRLEADAFAFACGPWLPDLFPDVLGELIVPHRQDVMHFAIPEGDPRWLPGAMPVWIDFEGSFYGFPSFDGVGAKACPDWLGPIERPDESAREVAESTIDASRTLLRHRFPALADRPVVKTWTCFYEVTPDANFVIDRHPAFGDTWIAGGGTGHAFKHGPVIGEYLAARITGSTAVAEELAPPDDRFALRAREASPSFRTSGRVPASIAIEGISA